MGEPRTGRVDRTSKNMKHSHVWKVYPWRPGMMITLCGSSRAAIQNVIDPGYDMPECFRCRKIFEAAARVGVPADLAV